MSGEATVEEEQQPPVAASTAEPAVPAPALRYPWIHCNLQHLARPIGQLHFHPRNARRHPKRNLDEIEASLREHGQVSAAIVTTRPMVLHADVESPAGTILVGNGRVRVARERLGWSHVAVLGFAGTDVAARKLALRDNRTSELAEWDAEQLGLELHELAAVDVDLEAIGWRDDEVDAADRAASPLELEPQESWVSPDAGHAPRRFVLELMIAIDSADVVEAALAVALPRAVNRGEALRVICAEWLAALSDKTQAP